MKKPVKLVDRLLSRLQKLGLTERKAKEVAKGLVPAVRAAIKAEQKPGAVARVGPPREPKPPKEGKPIRVNGHQLRTDLPVVPMRGGKGLDLLRVMDGLSTSSTYLVAAVKGEEGIVAIRQLGVDRFNVKFYPNMQYWGKTHADLADLGGEEFLQREYYERCHSSKPSLEAILKQLEKEAKPRARMKALIDRFLTVTSKPLLKAFGYLYQHVSV